MVPPLGDDASSDDVVAVVFAATRADLPASKKRRRISPPSSLDVPTNRDASALRIETSMLNAPAPPPTSHVHGRDDDSDIDEMLEALGIPDSDKKKRRQQREPPDVIELITPPRAQPLPQQQQQRQRQSQAQQQSDALRHVLELSDDDDDDGIDRESHWHTPRARVCSTRASACITTTTTTRNGNTAAVTVTTTASTAVTLTSAPSQRRKSIVDLTSPEQPPTSIVTTVSAATPVALAPTVPSQQTMHSLLPSFSSDERRAQRTLQAILTASPSSQDDPNDDPSDNECEVLLLPPVPLQRLPTTPPSDYECDALLDDLANMRPLAERIAAARERMLAPIRTTLFASTSSSARSSNTNSNSARSAVENSSGSAAVASPSRKQQRTTASASTASSSARLRDNITVVAMASTLDASEAGAAIKTALETHVYNSRTLAVDVGAPFESAHPNALAWQWTSPQQQRQNGATGAGATLAGALYYTADAFVALLLQQPDGTSNGGSGYCELRQRVASLRQELQHNDQTASSHQLMPLRTFVIVEGIDKCLIARTKKKRHAIAAALEPQPHTLVFSDVQELAFQLFMDTETHTQFTVDLADSAAYVALLTRELSLAETAVVTAQTAALPRATTALLESVPRLHAVRVTPSGATTNVFANAWVRMLQLVPGVSEDRAQRVVDHFPTLASLLRAYRTTSSSSSSNTSDGETADSREELLATVLTDRQVNRALSRRLFRVFCIDDPDALI